MSSQATNALHNQDKRSAEKKKQYFKVRHKGYFLHKWRMRNRVAVSR